MPLACWKGRNAGKGRKGLGDNAIAGYGEQWIQLCSYQDKSYLLEAPYGNGKIAIAQFHRTFWDDSEMCMRMTDNIVQWAAKELDKNKNVAVLDSSVMIRPWETSAKKAKAW